MSTQQTRGTRLPVIAAALAGALLLSFLVYRISIVNAFVAAGAQVGAMIAPNDARVVMARAKNEMDFPEGERAALLTAFESLPLSEEPLVIAARDAMTAGDLDRAGRLLAVAQRRDPRSRAALLMMLQLQLQQGKYEEAATTIAILSRVVPNAGQLLAPQLALMVSEPSMRDTVVRLTRDDPALRAQVLEQLARRDADPELIFSLAGPLRPSAGAPGDLPRWQELMLERMVERGDVTDALGVWRRLTGVQPDARPAGVYDGQFARLPGPPPFNWDTVSGGNGFAELARGSQGLQVEFYGRGDINLASQLLLLAPGSYRLETVVEGEPVEGSSSLSWVVSCHPGDRQLGSVAITGVTYAPKTISGTFTVPGSGCASQWLRLSGRAMEFPKDQQFLVRSIQIVRGGGG